MKTQNIKRISQLIILMFLLYTASCNSGSSGSKKRSSSSSFGDSVTSTTSGIAQANNNISIPLPTRTECVPGANVTRCPNDGDGGPVVHKFWAKDRSADAKNDITSFYQVDAARKAVSKRFVLYLQSATPNAISTTDAETILKDLETIYDKMTTIYGNGIVPDVQGTGRIVIFAYDIKDGYSADTNPSFIGGFVAPRDFYANSFTSSLYDRPENITNEAYGDLSSIETPSNLRGYSNENQILYLDINPFYNGVAYGSDSAAVVKSKKMFYETIIHEMSHLFTYHYRVIELRQKMLVTGISEGIAEQAPMLLASLMETQKERMAQYALPAIQNYYATTPPSLGDLTTNTLAGYVQSNLFFNYLRHRSESSENAATLIRTIVTAADEKITSIETSLKAVSSNESLAFSSIFGDWVLTNYLSGIGRTITSLTDENGASVDLGSGTISSRKYDLSYDGVSIRKHGDEGVAFAKNSVAFGSNNVSCLPPASSLYLSYTSTGKPITYVPQNQGMAQGLKLALITLPNETGAAVALHNPGSSIVLNSAAILKDYHLFIYNPNATGECLTAGKLPSGIQALVSWVGGGKNGWQIAPGAEWNNDDSYFYRTSGTALALINTNSSDKNYVYVGDTINHSISRWDIDNGSFEGRMGSKNEAEDCAGESDANDGWKKGQGKLRSNHCVRSFNGPRGIAVDSQGYIYITDMGNFRIVKRDKDGNFVAWLGAPARDSWQTGPGLPRTEMSGYETTLSMFNSPWGIAIDETTSPAYMYIVNRGSSRVVRRVLSTGAYAGFIGNGVEGWNIIETQYNSDRLDRLKYMNYPEGITFDDNYLYVADSENHRITRWTKAGGKHATTAGGTEVYLGGEQDGWHSGATSFGATKRKSFYYPSDVGVHGTYLYIADRRNQRVSRWNNATGTFAGWIGGGTLEWRTDVDGPSQEPVGSGNSYPPVYMLEPTSISIGVESAKNTANTYLYATTIYNARVSRWNLNCLENNVIENCSE